MKVLIIIISIFSVPMSLAQESSLSSVTSVETSTEQSAYIGFNVGGSYGEVGYGATYGRRLNESNILEFNYKTWTDREVEGLNFSGPARVAYNGFGVGASNKYFFYNSFFVKGGAFYRTSTINIPQGLNIVSNGQTIQGRDIAEISGEIALGNHWFGKNWGFAIDWFSYTPTLITIDEVQGFENGNLQVLNFTLSYSF